MTAEHAYIEAPDFIGLTADAALTYAESLGVRIEGPEPDGPSILGLSGIVVAQRPTPGELLPVSAAVVLTIEDDDGGAGAREPRRPLPPHGSLWTQASDDA